MVSKPKISIIVPIHNMQNGDKFLWRLVNSLTSQTFKDWELIITKEGRMAENTNAGIKKARGEIIKILYLDDYLAHPNSLQIIVDNFKGGWLATGCLHDNGKELSMPHYAKFDGVPDGINNIGSPSVMTFENSEPLLFDENLSWYLDVELYKRLGERYGQPTILDDLNVVIGIHAGQMTRILTNEEKLSEQNYFLQKYGK